MSVETRSAWEIERWTSILEKGISGPNARTAEERLGYYLAGIICGREFNEPGEEYFARKGLTEFMDWARDQIKR